MEVSGEEGMTLYLVIEDDEGNRTSYPLNYANGSYTAEIPEGEGKEGYDYWISDAEDGDPMEDAWSGSLPPLKEKMEHEFPVWIIILIIVLLLLAVIVVLIAMKRGSGGGPYEE